MKQKIKTYGRKNVGNFLAVEVAEGADAQRAVLQVMRLRRARGGHQFGFLENQSYIVTFVLLSENTLEIHGFIITVI